MVCYSNVTDLFFKLILADMEKPFYELKQGLPLITTAIHNGHRVRDELKPMMKLDEKKRFYEEDPFTEEFTQIAETQVIGRYSRFELDLNRNKMGAIYLTSDEAWGLELWTDPIPPEEYNKSMKIYDEFYQQIKAMIKDKIDHHGFVVVYDFHSYNFRRKGPEDEAPQRENPDINIGTKGIDQQQWGPVIKAFDNELKKYQIKGKPLDVRENVKFQGGHFPNWINTKFNNKACALAIEVKKIYMDEWSGHVYPEVISQLQTAMSATIQPVMKAANNIFQKESN